MASAIIVSDLLASPDLDGVASNAKRRWRRVGLHVLWKPYESLAHRSIWSHGPIIADIIRLAYLGTIVIVAYFIFCVLTGGFQRAVVNVFGLVQMSQAWLIGNWEYAGTAFLGLATSTGLHSLADWVTGEADKVQDWIVPKKKGKRHK